MSLQTVSEYAPRNPECATAALQAMEAQATRDDQAVIDLERALAEARQRQITSNWAFHDAMLAAKAEVIAQFGSDSTVLKAVGLKPRSERKRPARRKAAEVE